jgi:hypothetical protein
MIAPPPRKRRRLVIQLAALVDLLFVVMFLQYTEQTRSAAEESAKLQKAAGDAEGLKKMVVADQDNLRKNRDDLQAENEELKKRLAKETRKSADVEKQLQEIGQAATELIKGVDPKALTETLRGAPAGEVDAILAAMNDTKGKNAAQIVQMLRKTAELKNWTDIWEVHLFDDSRVRVRGPGVRDKEFTPSDENDFTIQFMSVVKQAGEPKSLVIVMFTHGNAELKAIDMVTKGLDQVRTVWSGQAPGKKIQVTAPRYSAQAP